MAGKASDNHFTPLQKLSAVAPCNQELQSVGENIQNHPAFGFKAGLIKAIGNLAHQHKENQKLVSSKFNNFLNIFRCSEFQFL